MLAGYDDAGEFTRLAAALAADRPRMREFGRLARQTAEKLAWGQVVEQFEMLLLAVAGAQPGASDVVTEDAILGAGSQIS